MKLRPKMQRTLLVTNDFPPRAGGIQTFLEGFAKELDPQKLVVYTSLPSRTCGGQTAEEYDSRVPYAVVRDTCATLLPTPRVRRKMQDLIRSEKIVNVWFGAAAPLGLLASAAREAGAKRIVATTHGHEIGWSMLPGARQMLKKIFRDADTVTYLTRATLERLRPCLGETQTVQLHGAISPEDFAFHERARMSLRRRYGIAEHDVAVSCISRLVKRKGQDMLIEIWPRITARFPGTKLVIVGKGPNASRLHALRDKSSAAADIIFTGEVPYRELAAHYCLGDVFAMPCRTRGKGLDIEGLGIVYLEAYAAGLPVLAGDSGGAPEAVQNGRTGIVVNGHRPEAVTAGLLYLLENRQRARQMGAAGLEWVKDAWTWHRSAQPLINLLS